MGNFKNYISYLSYLRKPDFGTYAFLNAGTLPLIKWKEVFFQTVGYMIFVK